MGRFNTFLIRLLLIVLPLTGGAAFAQGSGGYTEQALTLDNGEYRVPGILTTPVNATQKLPVVLMLHGTASTKNEVGGLYQRLAARLAGAGYASLRIDFAGTGDSPVDYREYSLDGARRDAVTALDYLATQPALDVKRMGLIGYSQGGLIAQLVVAGEPRIKALVTWSSTAGDGLGIYGSFVVNDYYDEARRNGFAVVKFPWRAPLNFGLRWFQELERNTSLTDLAHYHGKLLAIAGTADELVPYESSIRLLEAVGTRQASVYLVKDASHTFNVLADDNTNGLNADQSTAEEVLTVTADWFARSL